MEKDYSILLNEVKEKVEKRITEIHKDEDLKVTGTAFEDIVLDELVEAGIKKEEISHSARKFPDFVIEDKEKGIRIGLEVKKTDEDKWEVPGGSIFESLRNHIEETYVLMGKLGGTPATRLRRYAECIKDLKVTHSPRFQLDLELEKGGDYLTKNGAEDILELPEGPELNRRIRELLRTDKDTWYSSEESIVSFSDLKKDEKEKYFVDGVVLFPEVIGGNYSNFAPWMTYKCLVWCRNIRDVFSAGSNVEYEGIYISQAMRRILERKEKIFERIEKMSEEEMRQHWGRGAKNIVARIAVWCEIIKENIKISSKLLGKNSKLEKFKNVEIENIEATIVDEYISKLKNELMKFC